MRSTCTIEQVKVAAMKVVGIETKDLISRDKSPIFLPKARQAVAGAMYDLGDHEPSLTELAKYLGHRHHTTVMDYLRRYHREWPPVIRRLWEQAVLKELEAGASHQKAPASVGTGRPPHYSRR